MAKSNEHGQIIAAAAKRALDPLGLIRKGRSRVWYSDQRSWIIIIDFQPSGWSKGSYLNTGVKWLWAPGPGYTLGDRPVDFVPFKSEEQFAPPIERMAERAALEVQALRERFKSFDHIFQYLLEDATRDGWPIYYAAVAAGLVGDEATSRQLFRRLEEWPTYGYEWQLKLKDDSAAHSALLSDPAKFRSNVLQIIEHNRSLMKLPPDPNCLEGIDFQAGR